MKKISDILKKDWGILIIILLGFAIGIYFYPSLPSQVPIHWNLQGQVNGYGSKAFGALGFPLMNLGMYVLLIALPYLDPKRKNYERFKSTYQYLKYLFIIFFLGIEVTSLLTSTGVSINTAVFVQILISLLLILLGNVMGRFKHNYFVGIKTPWTLANEEVWTKTHRMAGPIWVIGGILNILLTVTGVNFNGIAFIIIISAIVIVPIVYSYFIYQQIVNVNN